MSPLLQHHLNPLHVFCRLRNIGIAKTPATFLCMLYERLIFNIFFVKMISFRIRIRNEAPKGPVSNGSWLK